MSTTAAAINSPLLSIHSHRLKILLLIMFGMCSAICMRLNLSMAIVCMVKPSGSVQTNLNISVPQGCVAQTGVEYAGDVEWSSSMQSMLFSAAYYGSLFTSPIAGRLADKHGPKLTFMLCMLPYTVGTYITPLLARSSYTAIWIDRFIMGVGDGFLIPSMGAIISRWFPASERSTVAVFSSSGFQLASLVSTSVSASLCKTSWGWPSIFYVFASSGLAWMILWCVFVSNTPTESRWASVVEKQFLEGKVAKRATKQVRVPYRHIIFSPCTNTVYFCFFANNFGTGVMTALLPSYFKEHLYLPLNKVSLYTTVYYICQLLAKFGGGMVSDYLNNTNKLTFTNTAKLMQGAGSYITLFALAGLAFLPSCEDPWWSLIFLGFFGLGASMTYSGFFASLVSVAPPYAGTVIAVAMIYANIGSLLGPMMVGVIGHVTGNSPMKWIYVFLLGGILMAVSATTYLIWGSADVQPWGTVEANTIDKDESSDKESSERGEDIAGYTRFKDSKF
ncbi:hypothetical protein PFISCL1PPCAC_6570 [Pristionchus fissidentatus]|uniref:Major facilitator superfamily (MFS) profile domain-containing protein n=1 Tax=Pristionchus fissidentatus TaxID=1538716 RepID=A0AAV5V7V2_9BILA|nr:hypothetical protein PFISCL1PPCAC_6570 [Pristionchus fissidentatus]